MSELRRLLTRAALCEALGVRLGWFAHNRAALEAAGFPKPLPGFHHRYDSVAVTRWLDRQAGIVLAAAGEPAAADNDATDWPVTLIARGRALAAG